MKKFKSSIPQVQITCIMSTRLLYHKYKPFVPKVQTYCTTSMGLSEQPQETIGINERDYRKSYRCRPMPNMRNV